MQITHSALLLPFLPASELGGRLFLDAIPLYTSSLSSSIHRKRAAPLIQSAQQQSPATLVGRSLGRAHYRAQSVGYALDTIFYKLVQIARWCISYTRRKGIAQTFRECTISVTPAVGLPNNPDNNISTLGSCSQINCQHSIAVVGGALFVATVQG
ncbi:MAG: hypothetical protein N2663_02115 [Chlorobi bacterium]|nr:hypothetical protein [Chlorobiota bacterium]